MMKMPLSIKFWIWIVAGLAVITSAAALLGHRVCVDAESTRTVRFVCEAKGTDIGLVYLTYCLVVVGWFGIRSSQEAAEKVSVHTSAGIRTMIEDRDGVRIGIHLGIRNTGRTVGIIKTGHSAVITKEADDDPIVLSLMTCTVAGRTRSFRNRAQKHFETWAIAAARPTRCARRVYARRYCAEPSPTRKADCSTATGNRGVPRIIRADAGRPTMMLP